MKVAVTVLVRRR